MTDLTLTVPEIHCQHCKMSIEGAVGALEGVSSAEVDVEATTVAVTFETPATEEAIVAAIEGQGYDVPPQG